MAFEMGSLEAETRGVARLRLLAAVLLARKLRAYVGFGFGSQRVHASFQLVLEQMCLR